MGIGRLERYRLPIWLRGLATAKVAESPGSVSQHAKFPTITKQLEERAKGTLLEYKVTASRTVTSNVAERPNSLFANIWFMTAEKFHKNRDSASLNDHLCLFS
jgi:hypothetical protein